MPIPQYPVLLICLCTTCVKSFVGVSYSWHSLRRYYVRDVGHIKQVFRGIIFVCQHFVAGMKGIDKSVYRQMFHRLALPGILCSRTEHCFLSSSLLSKHCIRRTLTRLLWLELQPQTAPLAPIFFADLVPPTLPFFFFFSFSSSFSKSEKSRTFCSNFSNSYGSLLLLAEQLLGKLWISLGSCSHGESPRSASLCICMHPSMHAHMHTQTQTQAHTRMFGDLLLVDQTVLPKTENNKEKKREKVVVF